MLNNLEVINAAVSLQGADDINFYRTESQVNAEIKDHLETADVKTIEVKNVSVDKLVSLINNSVHEKIILSVTTNGTEIEISKTLIQKIQNPNIRLDFPSNLAP